MQNNKPTDFFKKISLFGAVAHFLFASADLFVNMLLIVFNSRHLLLFDSIPLKSNVALGELLTSLYSLTVSLKDPMGS